MAFSLTSLFCDLQIKPQQLSVFLISSGQSYGTNKAIQKKDENGKCNLMCLNDDIYKMSKYFYGIGASVTLHHNNKVTISDAKKWFREFFEHYMCGPKVIYYTGHGDKNGNLCFDDGQLSLYDILKCTVSNKWDNIFFIKDCCFAGAWGEFGGGFGGGYQINKSNSDKYLSILCSSLCNQTSATGKDCSKFTQFLLTKLPKDKSLGKDGDAWITHMRLNYKMFEKRLGTQISIMKEKMV